MLEPYRVLDLTDERGMLCGSILADLGADVIAVEPPGGSPARRLAPFYGDQPGPENSLVWWAQARGKRSIVLDLETEAGRDRFRDLVRTSDFVIESFEPGRMDRLGFGYAALSAINPRLVMVSITPFGQRGPKANWAATDLTAWAASGTLLITGDEDRPPVQVPCMQAWLHAGAEAAAGALIAHAGAVRDGAGQHVDVSAQTAAIAATQSLILQAGWGDNPLSRVAGGVKAGPIRLRFIYPCKDGHVSVTFLFGSAVGPFTRRLFEWMEEEGFVDEATRDKDWLNYIALLLTGTEPLSELQRCIDAIERFTRTKMKAELLAEAMRRHLLIVPVSDPADVVNSEQLAARDYWTPIEHPELGQTFRYPGPFAKFAATPIDNRRRAPLLGEHTEEVLGGRPSPRPAGHPSPSIGRGEDAELLSNPGSTVVLPLSKNWERGPGGEGRSPRTILPLAGLKVLEFAWVVAAPAGVRYLSDYGATVVHVESSTRVDTARTIQPYKDGRPEPERSGLYANVNAGKLGITLNLAKPEARAVALRLAEWADVVVESYSPRAMRAWGLDYASLRKVNPGLIMLSSCLNGQDGPRAALAGFGTMGAQIAGFGAITGWPDRDPAGAFGAYTDYVSQKYVPIAILAALEHRRRTGQGQFIDMSQAETSIHFLGPAMLDYTVNGRVEERRGNVSPNHAPHGVYPTRNAERGTRNGDEAEERPNPQSDVWVAVACATDDQWLALCDVIGRSEWREETRFATAAGRIANHDELDAGIARWTAGQDVDTVEQALQAAGAPVHRVSSSADAFADPQLQFRGHFVTVAHPTLGPVPLESSRMRFSATPAELRAAGPTYGEHNDRVLRDILGMSHEAIVELVTAGALE